MEKKEKIELVELLEEILDVHFPRSYREFLTEHGTAKIAGYTILGIPEREEAAEETEEKKEEGTVLFFRPGDLRKGKFAWVSNYQGRVVGLCSLDNCRYCNLERRTQLKDFHGGNLKVNLYLVQRPTNEFYVAHFVSLVKPTAKTKKQRREMSVAEATQFLWKKRPELVGKKLIPICFKRDLNTEKLMALCMDLSQEPKDDAPLVQISDIDDQQAEPVQHDHGFFGEWIAFLNNSVSEMVRFSIARTGLLFF